MEHLLVVDDDEEIRHLLVELLKKYGYEATSASQGEEMFHCLQENNFDLIILDLMLPGEDGLSLCRRLRAKSSVPIIMLTAAGDDTDRIVGLEVGADDYIAKPFNPRELVARIKAVLRRTGSSESATQISQDEDKKSKIARFAGWELDFATRRLVSPDDIEITISAGEYILLLAFLERPRQVLSRDQLLDYTQHRPAGPFDRSIDVQVSRLRQKIEEDPKKPVLIKTVRSGGYLFTPTVEMKSYENESSLSTFA